MTRRKRKPASTAASQGPERHAIPPWQWWVLSAGIPLLLCASKLNLDLWNDEVYTLVFFVSKPWTQIATDYSAPNNHIFYSLLLRPFYLVSDSDFLLRLPSFLFTAGALAMVFRLARRWGGVAAGAAATLALGLTQMYLVHTMQVRGYGLSMFLAAWLGDLALPGPSALGRRRLPAVALIGGLFLYVMPTNVLFLLPLAVVAVAWTAARERTWRAILVESAAWIGACLTAGLLYLPVADQVLAAGADRARANPVAAAALAGSVFSAAARDLVPILPLVAVGLGCWARQTIRKPSRRQAVLPLLTVAMLLGPFCVTALLGLGPFVRNYCPLLPFFAVAMGWLLAELVAAAGRLLRVARSEAGVAAVAMLLLAGVALPRIWTYPVRLTEYRRRHFAQDGYYNYYAANFHPADVVAHLQQSIDRRESYLICFRDADHFSLGHYLRRAGLPVYRAVGRSPAVVYTITPDTVTREPADCEALSAKFALPADLLRESLLVRDFGYYRLHRCRQPLPLKRTIRTSGSIAG